MEAKGTDITARGRGTDIAIVGAGLFGRILADWIQHLGIGRVVLFDCDRPGAGSKPAGCVIRPSWVSALGKTEFERAMQLLGDLYPVVEEKFRFNAVGRATCFRVEPSLILRDYPKAVRHKVTSIEGRDPVFGTSRPTLRFNPLSHIDELTFTADVVVVAAGIWTRELLPEVEVEGRWGWAFRGPPVAESVIQLWAPYRQVVAFNMMDDRSWLGDGSALIERSFTGERRLAALARCLGRASPRPGHERHWQGEYFETIVGARPYCRLEKGEPCLLREVRPRVWALTGGGKNGTVSAAWAAREFVRRIAG